MDTRQLFALNLRRLRHERGLSQEALAYEANVNRAHVSAIERGVTWVGLEIVDKFAKVLDVELTEFFRPPTPRAKRPR
jgi:transcriptional regulator with XRE-family HTH domain